jgi:eukaryotic-like serine/threonine-protein kinase
VTNLSAPDPDPDLLDESLDESLVDLLEQFEQAIRTGQPWQELDPETLLESQRAAWDSATQAIRMLARAGPFDRPMLDRAPSHHLPTRIGRFEIERMIGAGGFAVVYLGLDPYTGRRAAIKIPRPHVLLTASLRDRFVREAQAAAKLDHPHIVPIFEAGLDGDLPYLVSSYCDGPTLSDWVKHRPEPLPIRVTVELMRSLAQAVQHSHAHGVLHRDITPRNVLLMSSSTGPDELPYVARLSDFGLAKLLESELDETMSSALMGTPAYMAPERALRNKDAPGVPVDVYGLGAVLYFVLTGRPPFVGDTAWETLMALRDSQPVPPRMLRPGIPLDVETICLKCLERTPHDRYPTAAALADDLDRYLAGRPILARRVTWGRRLVQWCRRHPLVAGLSATVALAVVLLLVGMGVYSVHVQELNRELVQKTATLTGTVSQLDTALRDKDASQQLAEESAQQLRNTLYSVEINRAAAAWKRGDVRVMNAILKPFQQPPASEPDLREFGWHYLWQQQSLTELFRETTPAAQYAAQFSPDGSLVAFAGLDSVVRIVSTSDRKVIQEIPTHQTEVNFVLFGPQGDWLATAGDDGTVAVWDLPTGQPHALWKPLNGQTVYQLAYSAPLNLLAVCGKRPQVVLLDPQSGERVAELPADDQGDVEAIALSPDGLSLLECRAEKRALIWDLSARHLRHREKDFGRGVAAGAWSPDGLLVAVGSLDGQVRTLLSSTGQLIRTSQLHDPVQTLAWMDNGELLAGDRSGSVTVLRDPTRADSTSDDVVARWSLHEHRLYGLATSPDGTLLATASRDRTIGLFRPNRKPAATQRRTSVIGEVEFTDPLVGPDRHGRWYGISDSGLYVIEASASGRRPQRVDSGHFDELRLLNDTLLLTTSNGSLTRWDTTADVRRLDTVQAFPDGVLLLDVLDQNRVFLRRERTETDLWSLEPHKRQQHWLGASVVAVAPDRRTFALANGVTHGVVIYDASTYQPLWTAEGHTEAIACLRFDHAGRYLFSCGDDRSIIAWDVQQQQQAYRLRGHESRVDQLALSPDGRTLVSADSAATVRLWDLLTHTELFVLYQHNRMIAELNFTADGQDIVALDNRLNELRWSIRETDIAAPLDSAATHPAQ